MVEEFTALPKNVCSSHGALPKPAGLEPGQPLGLIPNKVWVDASLETLSTFRQGTGAFLVPLFPIRLITPVLPSPASHLYPSLFHLPKSSS